MVWVVYRNTNTDTGILKLSLLRASSICFPATVVYKSQCQIAAGWCWKTSALQTKMGFICFPRLEPGWNCDSAIPYTLYCSDRLHAHCSMSLSMLSKLEQIMIFCVLHIFFSKYLSEAQAVLTQ